MLPSFNGVPNTADNNLMRPINQRLPNTNTIHNSNSASLPSQGSNGMNDVTFRPASVINLSHSSDVVIGPMTQYQGAVTIYQYMDATVEASIGRMPGGQGLGWKSNKNTGFRCRKGQCIVRADRRFYVLRCYNRKPTGFMESDHAKLI